MSIERNLIEIGQAMTLIVGAVIILGVGALSIGFISWVWLKVAKWLKIYINKASMDFKESFKEVKKVKA